MSTSRQLDDLYADIEQMHLDGFSAERIAQLLECDVRSVQAFLASETGSIVVTHRPKRGKAIPLKTEN